MIADLKNYTPEDLEFVLDEEVKDLFPLELDFLALEGENLLGDKKLNNKRDVLRFVSKHFTSTFPENELVERKLDDFEKSNIREEYCELQENVVPERKRLLEEALEESKRIKKEAEEAYASVLMEVAKYAAEVKHGIRLSHLKAGEPFCIALAGYYLVYAWNEKKNKMVLAKAYEIPDRSEIWANEEQNRQSMIDVFGIELSNEVVIDKSNDLPFG